MHFETEIVRYVYQPIESIYLLLLTSKRSNIEEDLDSLRLLSEQVYKKTHPLDEDGILYAAFDLCFVFDNIIFFGHTKYVTNQVLYELVTLGKYKKVVECEASDNDKDKIVLPLGHQAAPATIAGSSKTSFTPPTDTLTLTAEEKLNVILKREGGVGNSDVQGTLSLQILNQDNSTIRVQDVSWRVQPGCLQPRSEIRKYNFKANQIKNQSLFFANDLFSNDSFLGLKDCCRPFTAGQAGGGVGLLNWRMSSVDELVVPLSINCWPSRSCNDGYAVMGRKGWALFDVLYETYVSIEYEESTMLDLQNVVISVPLPALEKPPIVKQIDGEWRYDSENSILEWSIILIDISNRSGSMEFVVPLVDTSIFFPKSVRFTAASMFSELKVANVLPMRGEPYPKFTQRTLLSTENYQLV